MDEFNVIKQGVAEADLPGEASGGWRKGGWLSSRL